jgi:alpha-galactosidase/6-phospho-beta-glucosidase family protein
METKKEKIKRLSAQILEPFALGLLALLFIIPTITVMNLTPITKELEKLDVLGVALNDEVRVHLIGGNHEIFSEEMLNKIDEESYAYSTRLNKRASDSYSKPILKIENKTEEPQIINFFGQTLTNTRSNISLIVNKEYYTIQDNLGETFDHDIEILSGQEVIIFLALENLSGVQFSEMFDMSIRIRE